MKKIIDFYLDTTPRQWLILWAETFGIDYKNPQRQFTEFIKSFYGVRGVGVGFSIIVHLLVLLMGFTSSHNFGASEDSSEATEINLEDKKALAELLAQKEMLEVTGVYYLNGTEKKKKDATMVNSALASLLKKLGSGSTNWALAKKVGINNAQASMPLTTTAQNKFSWQEATKNSNETNLPNGKVEDELTKHIAKYDSQFQSCYEKALLKDSSMNGKIEFLMKVGSQNNIANSQVRFEGVGLPAGKTQLEGCLRGVASNIRLPNSSQKIVDKTIKFYVMLKAW